MAYALFLGRCTYTAKKVRNDPQTLQFKGRKGAAAEKIKMSEKRNLNALQQDEGCIGPMPDDSSAQKKQKGDRLI